MFTSDQERRLRALRDSLPGRVLPGSDGTTLYPLRERIGEGGQGWVFRAKWNGSVDVVVKILRPETETRDSLARFQREARVLQMLSHQPRPNPHIVRFFDHAYATVRVDATGDSWTLPFTVLEYVDGATLERVLADAGKTGESGLGLDRARRILRHVTLALRDVHAQNVVHRDLKPSNILIDNAAGRGELAKVTDFGLAKLVDGLQRTTALAGATVGYAPPEQFEHGNKRVGGHTDVFSLAAIFYELVTGTPAFPFHESDHPILVLRRILDVARPAFARVPHRLPQELRERADVVASLDAVLAKAFSPEPQDRHGSVTELFDALDGALSALAGASSMPHLSRRGSVSSAPPLAHVDQAAGTSAPTLLASERGELRFPSPVPPARVSIPAPSRAAGEMVWRVVTPIAWSRPGLSAIAVAPDGRSAIGAGPAGILRWDGVAWTAASSLPLLEARQVRAIAWSQRGSVVLAGESGVVVTIVSNGAAWSTSVAGGERDACVFRGVSVDADGSVVLVGERANGSGGGRAEGVLAELARSHGGMMAPRALPIAECGPLNAVVRLGADVVACGDGGALVLVRADGATRVVRVCDVALFAMLPLGDGTAVAVGAGGFAFHVRPTLEAKLEAIQTTKDVYALARGQDGSVWAGGAQGRVLRRDPGGWTRVGMPDEAGGGAVRALFAGDGRVVAFCDGGAVVEGRTG